MTLISLLAERASVRRAVFEATHALSADFIDWAGPRNTAMNGACLLRLVSSPGRRGFIPALGDALNDELVCMSERRMVRFASEGVRKGKKTTARLDSHESLSRANGRLLFS